MSASSFLDYLSLYYVTSYLRLIQVEDLEIVKVTPSGKAILKNIIQNLQLKTLIDIFEKKE